MFPEPCGTGPHAGQTTTEFSGIMSTASLGLRSAMAGRAQTWQTGGLFCFHFEGPVVKRGPLTHLWKRVSPAGRVCRLASLAACHCLTPCNQRGFDLVGQCASRTELV